jgi:hypothetical protein
MAHQPRPAISSQLVGVVAEKLETYGRTIDLECDTNLLILLASRIYLDACHCDLKFAHPVTRISREISIDPKRRDPTSPPQLAARNRMVSGRPRRSPRQGRLSPRGTSSGHKCFLAVKPNQPEEDGEYGVPDVALPNVALPISHRQLPACHIKSPQSARPLIRGHEREANGSKQDKCRDHRQTFLLQPADYAPIRSMRLRPENSN